MVKHIALALIVLSTSGCFWNTKPPVIEIQEVKVPILYCPPPPAVERPELPIHQMTDQQKRNAGEVVKHYKATVKELQGYALQLERVLEQYGENSAQYDQLKEEILEKLKDDGVNTPSQ